MAENIVTISGNHYRYVYDQSSGKTLYRGPVGNAPALNEEEFNYAMTISPAENVVEIQQDIRPYIINSEIVKDYKMGRCRSDGIR